MSGTVCTMLLIILSIYVPMCLSLYSWQKLKHSDKPNSSGRSRPSPPYNGNESPMSISSHRNQLNQDSLRPTSPDSPHHLDRSPSLYHSYGLSPTQPPLPDHYNQQPLPGYGPPPERYNPPPPSPARYDPPPRPPPPDRYGPPPPDRYGPPLPSPDRYGPPPPPPPPHRYGPPPPPPDRYGPPHRPPTSPDRYGPPPPPPPPDRYGPPPPPPPPDRYDAPPLPGRYDPPPLPSPLDRYDPAPPPPGRYGTQPPPPIHRYNPPLDRLYDSPPGRYRSSRNRFSQWNIRNGQSTPSRRYDYDRRYTATPRSRYRQRQYHNYRPKQSVYSGSIRNISSSVNRLIRKVNRSRLNLNSLQRGPNSTRKISLLKKFIPNIKYVGGVQKKLGLISSRNQDMSQAFNSNLQKTIQQRPKTVTVKTHPVTHQKDGSVLKRHYREKPRKRAVYQR
ncbi:hypothetical protein LOTGIDRAFT_228779 [Lottia gigantea]|uniref:Uncharacterized protein n=1 Tax=Lottia gigantea TaxID=225164 RepID=V4BQW8_LOTGI|nr:hypothetical protein LOTGIDRAFT_228779 [Lottia gigantea]ESO91309.1 hypothetical protein LOTGIDRAFT_228779 [Lottia gigantea]